MGFFDSSSRSRENNPSTNYGRGFNLINYQNGREFIGWYPTRDAANAVMKQMMFSNSANNVIANYHIEAAT